ncbi:helix-turn-helix domain-containing protein [Aeropyrum camini]|uniref:Predicted transcriptional regulator n=1 Tax=Aeropyrum camini SY1 = JCM 12091 TaxID=1198449 RepID=U3TGC1_9CREN|nr:helix-turn-helix domain-containing protein [Aeropyrum camini]BAN91048.1 predicted transcriptional regulator [Aeropyrum camini SY1 = JCM 12091]
MEIQAVISGGKPLGVEGEKVGAEAREASRYVDNDGGEENGGLEAEDLILSYLENSEATPSELIRRTGLSKNRVYNILKHLVDKGVVEKRRDGRRVVYSLRRVEPQAASSNQG